MNKKVKLDFMVCPQQLAERAEIEDPVRVKITKPHSPILEEYLGQSGLKLARAGVEFVFTRRLAAYLVQAEVAMPIFPI